GAVGPVGGVGGGEAAGLAEFLDARRRAALAAHAAEPREGCRRSVGDGDEARLRSKLGQKLFDVARSVRALPASRLRRGPAAMEEVGGGDGEEAETGDVLTKFVPGGERFWHDRTHRDDGRFRSGAVIAAPIAALERAFAPAIVSAHGRADAAR